jgi:hypothetical protein
MTKEILVTTFDAAHPRKPKFQLISSRENLRTTRGEVYALRNYPNCDLAELRPNMKLISKVEVVATGRCAS